MANTTNGIYYPNDYNAAADVLADMKQMAESIDAKFGEVKNNKIETEQDISNIKLEQEKQNEDITDIKEKDVNQDQLIKDLQTQVIDLETENENIKNQIPVGEAEGENITITDSSDMDFKELRIGGNSWQETRSGKNLTDYRDWTALNAIGTLETTEDTLTLTNVTNEYGVGDKVRTLKPNTAYTAFCEYTFDGELTVNYGFRVKIGETQGTITKNNIVNFTTDDTGIVKVNFYIGFPYTGDGTTLVVKNIRLYEGTYTADTIPDYEEYGQMPSPEFRSEIRNVGDNVNEFDGELELGIYADSTGNKMVYNDFVRSVNFIPVKELQDYKFSLNGEGISLVVFEYKEDYSYNLTAGKVINATQHFTTEKGTKYITFRTGYETTDTTLKIKLEKGTKATPYSPYNCGNFNETVCNGNLAYEGWAEELVARVNNKNHVHFEPKDGRNCIRYVCSAGYQEYDTKYLFKINWKENTQYSFRFDLFSTSTNATNLAVEYTDGTFSYFETVTADKWNNVLFTSKANKTIKYLRAEYRSGYNFIDLDTFMVCEGTEIPNYIPHQSQQFTFPLAEGQRMYKDSYLADDGVHHKRGQIEFNGAEAFFLNTVSDFALSGTNYKTLNNGGKCLSSHYPYSIGGQFDNYIRIGNAIFIMIKDTRFTTLEEFRTYVTEQYANGTPLTVEYELAEEIIEPYTEEQQLVYNEIKKAHSYKNITHIFSTDEIKPIIKTIYRKDQETINKNYENRLAALESAIVG